MESKYGLEDRPPLWKSLLMGLQWCAVAFPVIIILGKVATGFHLLEVGAEIVYLQKMTFVVGLFLLLEVLWGHRLPLILGPSTVILIGIISSRGYSTNTIYTAILMGGAILSICGMTGLYGHLRRLFTPRIVAVVLLLIGFTLTPTIMRLITEVHGGVGPLENLTFAILFTLMMFILHRHLGGIWKSILVLVTMFAGSLAYLLIFPENWHTANEMPSALLSPFFQDLTTALSFDAGLIIAFLVCFVALSINDLSSIQSMNTVVNPPEKAKRINRGITLTGLANVASGFLGVVGQVNLSLSLGVVAATGCVSRFTLIPAAVILLALSFCPALMGIIISNVPAVLVGSVLIYILSSQLAAGLMVAFDAVEQFRFEDGLIMGAPLLMATVVAFLPVEVVRSFPSVLQPILGNAFIMGVLAVLLFEHVIFKNDHHATREE